MGVRGRFCHFDAHEQRRETRLLLNAMISALATSIFFILAFAVNLVTNTRGRRQLAMAVTSRHMSHLVCGMSNLASGLLVPSLWEH